MWRRCRGNGSMQEGRKKTCGKDILKEMFNGVKTDSKLRAYALYVDVCRRMLSAQVWNDC